MASPEHVAEGPRAARVRLIVPTRNGGEIWKSCARAIADAVAAGRARVDVLVMDSASADDTAGVAARHGFEVRGVDPAAFDHGGTRNLAARIGPEPDILVFLTQDAVLDTPHALDGLLRAFDDDGVAVAYARNVPHRDANPLAAHARTFNYPARSHVAGAADRDALGIKAVFASNSFAAYRHAVFRELGGFPEKSIVSEDMYFAARAALAGHKIAYVADAAVRHSHNYGPLEEFRRYFDIGVFQRDQAWIRQAFGGAGGEGKRYILSELRYLARHAPLWIPRACLHNALKMAGYALGQRYPALPLAWRRRFSMHRRYWDAPAARAPGPEGPE